MLALMIGLAAAVVLTIGTMAARDYAEARYLKGKLDGWDEAMNFRWAEWNGMVTGLNKLMADAVAARSTPPAPAEEKEEK